jgi:hypothetical protein
MRIGYMAAGERRACKDHERNRDQRAVESEQAVLGHSLVGFEQQGSQRTDDGPEQADRAVDPGVVEGASKNHGTGDGIVLEDRLSNCRAGPSRRIQMWDGHGIDP